MSLPLLHRFCWSHGKQKTKLWTEEHGFRLIDSQNLIQSAAHIAWSIVKIQIDNLNWLLYITFIIIILYRKRSISNTTPKRLVMISTRSLTLCVITFFLREIGTKNGPLHALINFLKKFMHVNHVISPFEKTIYGRKGTNKKKLWNGKSFTAMPQPPPPAAV